MQGESGQTSLTSFTSEEDAEKNFKKKFNDKTGNKWDDRAKFIPKPKKYTLLVMGESNITNLTSYWIHNYAL